MKKITKVLRMLEKAAREMLVLQTNYDKRGLYIEKSELTGRNIEFTKNGYFPAKMREYVETGHGYFTSWHWFSDRFYDTFNRLDDTEQYAFISNLYKYKYLFSAIKAGYMYNFPRIYEEWGYDPILKDDYYYMGEFDEDEYERDLEEDRKRYLHYANIKLKNQIDLLAKIIYDGVWSEACPGHHKISRMKHNPW